MMNKVFLASLKPLLFDKRIVLLQTHSNSTSKSWNVIEWSDLNCVLNVTWLHSHLHLQLSICDGTTEDKGNTMSEQGHSYSFTYKIGEKSDLIVYEKGFVCFLRRI